MAETKTVNPVSHLHNVPGFETWKKLVDDQNARVGQWFEEMGKAQAKFLEYGQSQLDEANALAKSQFKYANDLAADFRKLSLENAKKATEMFR